ncbi:MAG: hypothetical protein K9I94_15305 [Bacteroidales bacterium]|nr:hypothetical protein [Bacteroidales bacterium]
MKKVDKLKKQRYEVEIRLLKMDEKGTLTKNQEQEKAILQKKKEKLDQQIKELGGK